ncbi:TnsA-like heteromeric transposase endonuclease subunit [Mycobacterium sp. BMJ-28]
MAISPCPARDVNPPSTDTSSTRRKSRASGSAETAHFVTSPPSGGPATLPVNDAPYTTILYQDPVTGRRVRSRIDAGIGRLGFESSAPIRTFPAYRGRRSHQGRYWFSRSQSHVQFESRFEMTALMVLDFRGETTAVSSNPFWLLWPKGSKPMRHAPDFFARRRDGSVLVVDVKPAARVTADDRVQHARTRGVCTELGWDYEEFTALDAVVERNLRLLSGYHHPRFAPPEHCRARVTELVHTAGAPGLPLSELVDKAAVLTGLSDGAVVCILYHMLWCAQLHADLNYPLTWKTVVRA